MVGITEFSALISSLKGAKDLAEAMVGLRDATAFQSKVIEFQGAIMDAQQHVFAVQEERASLVQKVSDLEKEVARLEAWETEKKRYELKKLGDGAFAQVLKVESANGEPPHALCTTCYDRRNKTILQIIGSICIAVGLLKFFGLNIPMGYPGLELAIAGWLMKSI